MPPTPLRTLPGRKPGQVDPNIEYIFAKIGIVALMANLVAALESIRIETMFTDVYKDVPRALAEQMRYAIAVGEGTKFEGAFPL